MMRFLGAAALVPLALLPLASTVRAQQPSDPVGSALSFASPERLARLSQELDLTPDQEVRIAALSEAFQREHGAALVQGQALVEELQAIYARDGEVQPEAMLALSQKYSAALAELLPATQVFLRDVNAMLTPEQRTKFQRIIGPAAMFGLGGESLDSDVP
jgi:Spy/CpxP family protein refolding chaperone